jgi:hypothetical protein
MQYQTIAMELILGQPELYEQLRSNKRLLPAIDAYSIELRDSHNLWKARLDQANPGSDSRQIASEAMELAIHELQSLLLSVSPAAEAEPLSLDAAMNFLRHSQSA